MMRSEDHRVTPPSSAAEWRHVPDPTLHDREAEPIVLFAALLMALLMFLAATLLG